MKPASYDIKDLIEVDSELLLELKNTPIYCNIQMPTKTQSITIYDTGGPPPQQTLGGGEYIYTSIQIRVRTFTYIEGFNFLRAIQNYLHNTTREINGTLYTAIIVSCEPTLLTWRDNGMVDLFINLNIQRR
ncbi:MAG: hypothetical protein B6I31_05505 [Desulfobacteraceae bacterium 4572_19]|nr:MAG: hypothetical protein B6I31_05505 [Desulfobacteraceae bacterium 4572_19]